MGSRLKDTARLFELYCEVSPGDKNKEPYIIRRYPESTKNEEELKSIPRFTFPCPLDSSCVQHYSFVLTSMDSKYTFCFCRYDPKANISIVISSHLPWHDIFYKLLDRISNISNGPERGELFSFLEACRIRPPMPGHTLKVTLNAGHSVFTCKCPDANQLPMIPDNCNITEYFSVVDTKCMTGLWAALLNERRVAIIANKPSRLSACVQAANETLFPMTWQHIFIPILPKHLADYLLAPMPYLIGVPRSVMETVQESELGQVVILDIDAKELRSPFQDLESLPTDLVSNLKKSLSNKSGGGDFVSRAFLRALVCLIGGYRDAIIEKGKKFTFNDEAFLSTRKNMQPLLKRILQSQIFYQFIEERLALLNSGHGFNDEFEVECMSYETNPVHAQRLKQQYKDWAKNVKKEGGAFFKNVKDKANPAVQSAVKSVRQGGRNMKSAVRGLKSRIPKSQSTPPSDNNSDNRRYSSGSVSPASSSSSSSSSTGRAPNDVPPPLPLDLLTEMEYLFSNQKGDSLPNSSRNSELSLGDKAKTLSPNIPPRLPQRPTAPSRYPIVPTRKLLDLSGAPPPPPRSHATNPGTFVTNITKNHVEQPDFQTSTIRLTVAGKGNAKLKLTMSSNQRRPTTPTPALSLSLNGDKKNDTVEKDAIVPPRQKDKPHIYGKHLESSESDLIKLDSPTTLDDFDPLMVRSKGDVNRYKSAESALLHEYGIDFSQYRLDGNASIDGGQTSSSNVPKEAEYSPYGK